MAVDSKTLPSLIQGISQQADIARGTASAEDQENCLNEVLDGVVSRMGSVFLKAIPTTYNDPFVHEIVRSETEQYMVITESGGLRIINKISGVDATITGSISSYLSHTGLARKAFQAVTIGDTTFLLNRQKVVTIGTSKSAVRANLALAYFKAGSYMTAYSINLRVGTDSYIASYTTPDNSVAGNAQYITTSYLATTLLAALNSTVFPAMATDGHGTFTGAQVGSTIVITGPAGVDFEIYTADGQGDTQLISFKSNVKSLDDLPRRCTPGYQVSVSADGAEERDKYFLKYEGTDGIGRWAEVVAPDTELGLNAATMPHRLVNTGLNAFTVEAATWGQRLAGDGVLTAKDPSFIGFPIRSLQFIGGRLAAVSEYQASLSRSRNAYVFFPDTVQTNLDTAPVDYDVSNGSSTLIEYAVVGGGKLQFWGNKQQTVLDSGQDPIREDTTDILPLANYEYDGEVPPQPVGLGSIIFGTTAGRWAKLSEVYFRAGRGDGEISITAHVPKLLDGKLRRIATGEVAGKVFALTEGKLDTSYLYQWYNQGSDRVQSAWNKWTFPSVTKVLWASISGDTAWFLFKWPLGETTLESVVLDSHGDEEEETLPLRLDHRLTETNGIHNGTDGFVYTLPYSVNSAARQERFVAIEREDILDVSQRGRQLPVEWIDYTSLKVLTTDPTKKFYFGAIPKARRKFSRFYARDRNDQVLLHERLLLKHIVVSHKDTTSYDVVVTKADGTSKTQTFVGRVLGDPSIVNNQVPIKTGTFKATVGEETEYVGIELVNNTPFPSVWTGAKYVYDLTLRDQ